MKRLDFRSLQAPAAFCNCMKSDFFPARASVAVAVLQVQNTFGRCSHVGRAPALLLSQKPRAPRAGNAIPPQVSGKETKGETDQNRDCQINHSGSALS